MGDEEDRQGAADRNRALFPLTAAELDGWRAVFGPGVRLRFCREAGAELGTPSWPERSRPDPDALPRAPVPGPEDDPALALPVSRYRR